MTRQMMRRAKRRIRKGKFPFPEFAKFLRSQTSINPKIFAQVRPGNQYITNLSGEKQTLRILEGFAESGKFRPFLRLWTKRYPLLGFREQRLPLSDAHSYVCEQNRNVSFGFRERNFPKSDDLPSFYQLLKEKANET